MRFGSALPHNILRLEYGNYIEEDFGYNKLGFSRGGFLSIEKNVEQTITETKLKTLWSQLHNNITEHQDDIELFRSGENSPYIFAYSNMNVGWWKIQVKMGGGITSGTNEIHIIEFNSSNYIFVNVGIGNALKLRKKENSNYSDLIDCNMNLSNNIWYNIEVTRDVNGNFQVWVATVLKGTCQDNFNPNPKIIKFIAKSDRSLFVSDLWMNYNRPT